MYICIYVPNLHYVSNQYFATYLRRLQVIGLECNEPKHCIQIFKNSWLATRKKQHLDISVHCRLVSA